ncbi:hypothetical protein PoB_004909900, partial [Plakobranchus ocellatus]
MPHPKYPSPAPTRSRERKERKPRVPKPSTYRHRDPYRNTKFWAGSVPPKIQTFL